MRLLIITLLSALIFLSLSSGQAIAQNSVIISGYVRIEGKNLFFVDAQTFKTFKLKAYTERAKQTLSQLKNLDGISGTGSVIGDSVLLDSIEFVGLRRLIGYWQTSNTVVNFLDFSHVNFQLSSLTSTYKYAVSPFSDGSWRVFFSDKQSVVLGSLTVSENSASIDLFDPETGETTKHLELKKVSN